MKINNFIVSTNGPGLYEVTTQVAKWAFDAFGQTYFS